MLLSIDSGEKMKKHTIIFGMLTVTLILFIFTISVLKEDNHGIGNFENVKQNSTTEPATMLLFGSGLIGISFVTRRKMK